LRTGKIQYMTEVGTKIQHLFLMEVEHDGNNTN
jgi:hypothetical protein